MLGTLIAVVFCAGMMARARWMLYRWELFAFGAGIAMAEVALFGAFRLAEAADRSLGSSNVFEAWPIWLALLGATSIAGALGSWWLRQRRLERLGGLAHESRPARRLGFGVTYRGGGMLDWIALILLPVGGLTPVLGWCVVMMLLWTSRAFTHREKMIAAVALPGGPIMAGIPIDIVQQLSWSPLAKLPLFMITVPLMFLPAAAAVFLAKRLWVRAAGPMWGAYAFNR